ARRVLCGTDAVVEILALVRDGNEQIALAVPRAALARVTIERKRVTGRETRHGAAAVKHRLAAGELAGANLREPRALFRGIEILAVDEHAALAVRVDRRRSRDIE